MYLVFQLVSRGFYISHAIMIRKCVIPLAAFVAFFFLSHAGLSNNTRIDIAKLNSITSNSLKESRDFWNLPEIKFYGTSLDDERRFLAKQALCSYLENGANYGRTNTGLEEEQPFEGINSANYWDNNHLRLLWKQENLFFRSWAAKTSYAKDYL